MMGLMAGDGHRPQDHTWLPPLVARGVRAMGAMSKILRSNDKMPNDVGILRDLTTTPSKLPKWLASSDAPLENGLFDLSVCCKPSSCAATPPPFPQRRPAQQQATPQRRSRFQRLTQLRRSPPARNAVDALPKPCRLDDKLAVHDDGGELAITTAADNLDCAHDELGKRLGEGSTGTVFMSTNAQGQTVAIKRVAPPSSSRGSDHVQDQAAALALAHHEAAALLLVHHTNVLALLTPVTDSPVLVLEFAAGGDLHACIARTASGRGMNETDTLRVLQQATSAIAHCHSVGVTHGDIKPENFLLVGATEGLHIRLADFGSARRFRAAQRDGPEVPTSRRCGLLPTCSCRHACQCNFDFEMSMLGKDTSCHHSTECGTPQYWPPEMFDANADRSGAAAFASAAAADAWALGCVLFACMTTMHPFAGRPCAGDTAGKVRKALTSNAMKKRKDHKAVTAVTNLLEIDPRQRISLSQLLL